MSIRRRSTVHDFSSLRLHPDGSRVQSRSDGLGDARLRKNKKPRTLSPARYAAFDTQRNRIALDAGGTASVKQRRRGEINGDGDGDSGENGGPEDPTEQAEDSKDLMNSGETSLRRKPPRRPSVPVDDTEDVELGNLKDTRAKKRRKFYRDFSFLDVSSPGLLVPDGSPMPDAQPSSQDVNEAEFSHLKTVFPVPSSDLLKCIHHFSSGYYAACGCLINAPKEARKERMARRSSKLARHVPKDCGRHESISVDEVAGSDSDHDAHQNDGSDSGSEDIQHHIGEDLRNAKIINTRTRKRRRRQGEGKPPRDMYKAFDGSALMAIGMLLQEHVKELVSAELPEERLRHVRSIDEVRGETHIREKLKFEEDQAVGNGDGETREERCDLQATESAGEKCDSSGSGDPSSDSSSLESSLSE